MHVFWFIFRSECGCPEVFLVGSKLIVWWSAITMAETNWGEKKSEVHLLIDELPGSATKNWRRSFETYICGRASVRKAKEHVCCAKWDNRRVHDLWSSVCNHGMCLLWKINWSNCQDWCCVATSESEREYRLRSQGGSKDDWQHWGFQREHDGTDRKIRGLNKGGELHAIRVRMANRTDSFNDARTRQDVTVQLWSRCPTGRICSLVPETYKRHSNLSKHIHQYHLCWLVLKCRGYSIVGHSERIQISPEKCTQLCECCSTSGDFLASHPEQAS
jgi:hypothetical protein